jgi:ribosome-associated protein
MKLLEVILKAIEEKQGHDVQVVNFKGNHSMMDGFIITDAPSNRQMWAIIDHIKQEVTKHGFPISAIEGSNSSKWVLIDCLDYVVHVFESDERSVYKLEKLWADYLKAPTSL